MIENNVPSPSSILWGMLEQEENCYRINDYFQTLPIHSAKQTGVNDEEFRPVNTDDRQEIVIWCMHITKACDYPEKQTAIIMSCLDRFVSTTDGQTVLLDRELYQLAALTALYTCVKIHCPRSMPPDVIAQLSLGVHNKYEIETMERQMLHSLQWRVNPPTAMDFASIYLNIIQTSTKCNSIFSSLVANQCVRETILEIVSYQTNLSVVKFELAVEKASHIAATSLMNAIECLIDIDVQGELYNNIFEGILSSVDTVEYEFIDITLLIKLKEKLYKFIPRQQQNTNDKDNQSFTTSNEKSLSQKDSTKSYSKTGQHDSSVKSPRSVL